MYILWKLNVSELSFTKILPNVFFHWVLFTVPSLVEEMEHLKCVKSRIISGFPSTIRGFRCIGIFCNVFSDDSVLLEA